MGEKSLALWWTDDTGDERKFSFTDIVEESKRYFMKHFKKSYNQTSISQVGNWPIYGGWFETRRSSGSGFAEIVPMVVIGYRLEVYDAETG